jgi:hypothetical protein
MRVCQVLYVYSVVKWGALCIHTYTHTPTNTFIFTHIQTLSLTHSNTHTYTHSLTSTNAVYLEPLTRTHTHTFKHSHLHILTRIQTLTHSLTSTNAVSLEPRSFSIASLVLNEVVKGPGVKSSLSERERERICVRESVY